MRKMKFLFFMGLLSMILGISACSKSDDDKVETGNSSIVGMWELSNWTINGQKCDLQVEFKSNKKGAFTVKYLDGTDPDILNFEYTINKVESEEYLKIIWTGTRGFYYQSNVEYDITITPNRLSWEGLEYTRIK